MAKERERLGTHGDDALGLSGWALFRSFLIPRLMDHFHLATGMVEEVHSWVRIAQSVTADKTPLGRGVMGWGTAIAP